MEDSVTDPVFIFTVNTAANTKLYRMFHISTPTGESSDVNMLLDTGSAVTTLPHKIYQQHFSTALLSKPVMNLTSYQGNAIDVVGCMQAAIDFENITANVTVFITYGDTALIGMDVIKKLGLVISSNSVLVNTVVDSFVHKVMVDTNAKPVLQKLRRLPLAVRVYLSWYPLLSKWKVPSRT
ncbi:hypothetical protein LOTGIDRAFT_160008 [Lottia gigantea]|uniref:Peptidase A2 domain-containing protein n=1 Tax=Lottia gigantea TaxID=225164 RepID=V4AQR8_LOTGI|nr:hypothetical protein LOTGIDRAFT_160008 [Lottia gigantea]ESO96026.1 hypothetical protein LOTGIDRAFT_160008 [Lottia gigantea]